MTDKYTALRNALAAGPTPGPWRNSEVDLRTCQVALVTEGFGVYSGSAEVAMPKVDAAYIAAADPDTIRALLDERDRWVAAGREWLDKTEWVQTNDIAPRYLGKHRADVLRDQIERLTAERDRLRAALELFATYEREMASGDDVAAMLSYAQLQEATRAAIGDANE